MLLNDIGKSPNATFKRINQHLETNYGFKIAEDTSDKDLVAIMEQIESEIIDLKMKGDDAKASPEISKRLLVLEGIRSLKEFAYATFESPDLEHVVNGLADFVHDSFRLGGSSHQDFDECVRDGMKHYRSSKYRFPDDMIEQKVRQAAMSKIHGPGFDPAGQHSPIDPVMAEDTPPFGFEKRASALGGHQGEVPNTELGKLRATQFSDLDDVGLEPMQAGPHGSGRAASNPDNQYALDNPDINLDAPDLKSNKIVPIVRNNATGKMQHDPFAAQAAARKQGIVMKENLVKNLRRLLETEVSQAEVMMAAKGFAQELQEMIEKIGRLQNEDLPPVTDQMRETYGTESASTFQTQIYGALQSVMDALYSAKGQVDDAVSNMASTGQVGADIDMDLDPGMDDGMGDMGGMDAAADMGADLDNIEGDMGAEDEFGGEEGLGRAMKAESVNHLQRKVLEMKKLVEKARRLRG